MLRIGICIFTAVLITLFYTLWAHLNEFWWISTLVSISMTSLLLFLNRKLSTDRIGKFGMPDDLWRVYIVTMGFVFISVISIEDTSFLDTPYLPRALILGVSVGWMCALAEWFTMKRYCVNNRMRR